MRGGRLQNAITILVGSGEINRGWIINMNNGNGLCPNNSGNGIPRIIIGEAVTASYSSTDAATAFLVISSITFSVCIRIKWNRTFPSSRCANLSRSRANRSAERKGDSRSRDHCRVMLARYSRGVRAVYARFGPFVPFVEW